MRFREVVYCVGVQAMVWVSIFSPCVATDVNEIQIERVIAYNVCFM